MSQYQYHKAKQNDQPSDMTTSVHSINMDIHKSAKLCKRCRDLRNTFQKPGIHMDSQQLLKVAANCPCSSLVHSTEFYDAIRFSSVLPVTAKTMSIPLFQHFTVEIRAHQHHHNLKWDLKLKTDYKRTE